MERDYYQDIGYRPFLFYIVFGVSGEELEVSREKHHVDELPRGLDIRTLTMMEHADYIGSFLSGPMGALLEETSGELLVRCREAQRCVILQGTVEDDGTLDYMRNVIGIIQAFIDGGAVGILDPQTLTLWAPDEWTYKLFGRDVDALRHVIVLSSKEGESFWLHTRGMAEFGRPDIGIYGVPEEKLRDYSQVIEQMIHYGGRGLFFEGDCRLHTAGGKAFVIRPEFISDFENDDYNNAYYSVTVLDEEQVRDRSLEGD